MKFVGFPDADGTRIFVTKTDLGALAVYLASEHAWIEAAALCLSEKRTK